MGSLWWETTELPEFGSLDGDLKTDVLIIGGGMAGILCAYMLDKAGVDYALLEGGRICSGITKNTTAKITSQHGLIYDKLIREFGDEKAAMYLEINQAALAKYRELCIGIDCDFEEKDSYVYSLNKRKKLEKEWQALVRLGLRTDLEDRTPLPFPVAGALRFRDQAQFHPLKFISAIVPGLHIYEGTPVREMKPYTATTDRGRIRAKKIIAATHFPFINKHGVYFIKMHQSRSYVSALENAQDVGGMYVDEAEGGMSFRNYGQLLLLGGGGGRTGKTEGGWEAIGDFTRRYYPKATEKYRWATQDCMSLDSVPYIGRYSSRTPDFYVATGFNKWGMTSSMVAAMILTDLITGKENEYARVFSPSRTILRPQLAVNALEAAVSLLTFTGKRCPHMGCTLKWNPQERSWDCPCHGSRFTRAGKLIDNPSTGDLKDCPDNDNPN